MTEDILKCAGQFEEPVVGVGHSLGGVLTLMAAAKKPALFQNIIILDPPLFSSQNRLLISILRAINIEDWVSPSGKSKIAVVILNQRKKPIDISRRIKCSIIFIHRH